MSLCGLSNKNDLQELKKNYMQMSYSILYHPNANIIPLPLSNYSTKETIFIHSLHSLIVKYSWIDIISFEVIKNKRIVQCLHIKNKSSSDLSSIIVYSQDEKSDLGSSLPFLIDLSSFLKMSIITYEYTDKAKHIEMIKDLAHLFTYLNKINTIDKFIMFGFSIGAYNTVSLIDTKMTEKIISMVLLSPNWGCSPSLLKHYKKFSSQIIKEQMELLSMFPKPIMLIHGKMDAYIKYMLSYQASKQISTLMEWYPKKGTHWDLHLVYRTKLYMKLRKFLDYKYSPLNPNRLSLNGGYELSSHSMKENFTPQLHTKISNSFQQKNEDNDNSKEINIILKQKQISGLLMEIVPHQEENSNNINNDSNNNYTCEYFQSFKQGELIPTSFDQIDWNSNKKNGLLANAKSLINSNNLEPNGFTFTDRLLINNDY